MLCGVARLLKPASHAWNTEQRETQPFAGSVRVAAFIQRVHARVRVNLLHEPKLVTSIWRNNETAYSLLRRWLRFEARFLSWRQPCSLCGLGMAIWPRCAALICCWSLLCRWIWNNGAQAIRAHRVRSCTKEFVILFRIDHIKNCLSYFHSSCRNLYTNVFFFSSDQQLSLIKCSHCWASKLRRLYFTSGIHGFGREPSRQYISHSCVDILCMHEALGTSFASPDKCLSSLYGYRKSLQQTRHSILTGCQQREEFSRKKLFSVAKVCSPVRCFGHLNNPKYTRFLKTSTRKKKLPKNWDCKRYSLKISDDREKIFLGAFAL